jgi:hypothetical protein
MATQTSDPTSTVAYTLGDVTGNDHLRVDDGIRSPTTTGFDTNRCIWSATDDLEEVEFGLSNGSMVSGDLITSVTIYSYIQQNLSGTITVRFRGGGSLTSTSNLAVGGTGYQWRTNTIGSLSLTHNGTMAVLMKSPTLSKGEDIRLEEIYVVITYTPASGGTPNIGGAGQLLNILGFWEDDEE